jgi:Zn-dependent M16 (insulinase) family peptidase
MENSLTNVSLTDEERLMIIAAIQDADSDGQFFNSGHEDFVALETAYSEIIRKMKENPNPLDHLYPDEIIHRLGAKSNG